MEGRGGRRKRLREEEVGQVEREVEMKRDKKESKGKQNILTGFSAAS